MLGEYNKNSANPLIKLEEVQHEHAFTTHSYKHTTMGFIKDIEDMPNQLEYSKTFFSRWYRPEYTTVIVAGDVKPAETIRLTFREEPGVLRLRQPTRGKRSYVLLRIPHSVAERVHRRLSAVPQ